MSIKEEIQSFLKTSPVYSGSMPESFTADYPLIESGILDSIGLFTLVVHIEDKFNVKIDPMDLIEPNFGNLEMIERFVEGKLVRP